MIKLDKVFKSYGEGEAQVQALSNISINIRKGDFICAWGTSGCGKTTLLNLVGLIDKPSQGKIIINDIDTSQFNDDQLSDFRNKNIGFVFQNFNLIPVLSALENVMLPLEINGVDKRTARNDAQDLLNEVGLSQELHRRPDKMSGGQRQRVAIARALVTKPSLILADEPTANLDSETSENIIRLIKTMNQEKEITFILSTHDKDLSQHAKQNLYLKDGKIVTPKMAEKPTRNAAAAIA